MRRSHSAAASLSVPASACSILLLDDAGTLRHGAAPSLPAAYSAAIDGLEPGPLAGSCGTAVHSGEPVIAGMKYVVTGWFHFPHPREPNVLSSIVR